jgi:TolB-like protein
MTHTRRPRTSNLALACLLAAAAACQDKAADPSVVTKHLLPETQSAAQPPVASNTALTGEVTRVAAALSRKLGNGTVAVLDFADLRGQVTQLGTYVSEQITTELVRAGQGRVLERKQVLQVLDELNLRKADLSNSEVELAGQQLGADIIVIGRASVMGSNVEGSARAVQVSGGSVLAAEQFSAAAAKEILDLAQQSVPGVPGPGGGTAGAADSTAGGPVTESTVGPVQVVLTECRAAGSVVNCAFTFTSATVDASLSVSSYSSEARDDGGNAYELNEFTFGSENSSNWRTVLVARESTPGRLMITGVPITMTRLTRISLRTDIAIGNRNLNNQWMVFRNIPIQR